MPAPVLDTIADLIVARLKAATYTSPYQIREVIRPNQQHGNFETGPFMCIVQLVSLEPGDPYIEEGPFYRLLATYVAETEVLQDDQSKEPHDRLASYLVFDMAKAITAADDDWAQWEGNAMNTRWIPEILIDEKGAIMRVGLSIEVDVCLSSVNPYVFRG